MNIYIGQSKKNMKIIIIQLLHFANLVMFLEQLIANGWAQRNSKSKKNRFIADEIEKIHTDSPDKGYRRIRDDLEHYHGIDINDKRVLCILP